MGFAESKLKGMMLDPMHRTPYLFVCLFQVVCLLCLELGRLATSRRGGCVTERPPRPRPLVYLFVCFA